MNLIRGLVLGAAMLTGWLKKFSSRELSPEEQFVERFIANKFLTPEDVGEGYNTSTSGAGFDGDVLLWKDDQCLAQIRYNFYGRESTVRLTTDSVEHALQSVDDYRKLPVDHKSVVYMLAKAACKHYDKIAENEAKEKQERQQQVDLLREKYLNETRKST